MFIKLKERKYNISFRIFIGVVLTTFMTSSLVPMQQVYAAGLNLPVPGTMVKMTDAFMPAMVKGLKVDPNNPLAFDFLIDPGQIYLDKDQKEIEYTKLIKYFLAALTTAEKDQWVNLSPYEHNRIISQNFGNTEMGRDMLAQDYILKQLSASLVYPEEDLGKKFWNKIYERVRMQTGGTAQVPVNTFNKVWILPESATVFEKGNVVVVTQSRLKVMMEEDYEALSKHTNVRAGLTTNNSLASQTVRDIVIPAIEKEVNEGKNFAQLRQMFNSMILASWFKQRLKMHLLNKIFTNKDKVAGVEIQDPKDIENVYQQYLKAYKKGVYNYIKEEPDPVSKQMIPKKYFSGGYISAAMATPEFFHQAKDPGPVEESFDSAMVNLAMTSKGIKFLFVAVLTSLTLKVAAFGGVLRPDLRVLEGQKTKAPVVEVDNKKVVSAYKSHTQRKQHLGKIQSEVSKKVSTIANTSTNFSTPVPVPPAVVVDGELMPHSAYILSKPAPAPLITSIAPTVPDTVTPTVLPQKQPDSFVAPTALPSEPILKTVTPSSADWEKYIAASKILIEKEKTAWRALNVASDLDIKQHTLVTHQNYESAFQVWENARLELVKLKPGSQNNGNILPSSEGAGSSPGGPPGGGPPDKIGSIISEVTKSSPVVGSIAPVVSTPMLPAVVNPTEPSLPVVAPTPSTQIPTVQDWEEYSKHFNILNQAEKDAKAEYIAISQIAKQDDPRVQEILIKWRNAQNNLFDLRSPGADPNRQSTRSAIKVGDEAPTPKVVAEEVTLPVTPSVPNTVAPTVSTQTPTVQDWEEYSKHFNILNQAEKDAKAEYLSVSDIAKQNDPRVQDALRKWRDAQNSLFDLRSPGSDPNRKSTRATIKVGDEAPTPQILQPVDHKQTEGEPAAKTAELTQVAERIAGIDIEMEKVSRNVDDFLLDNSNKIRLDNGEKAIKFDSINKFLGFITSEKLKVYIAELEGYTNIKGIISDEKLYSHVKNLLFYLKTIQGLRSIFSEVEVSNMLGGPEKGKPVRVLGNPYFKDLGKIFEDKKKAREESQAKEAKKASEESQAKEAVKVSQEIETAGTGNTSIGISVKPPLTASSVTKSNDLPIPTPVISNPSGEPIKEMLGAPSVDILPPLPEELGTEKEFSKKVMESILKLTGPLEDKNLEGRIKILVGELYTSLTKSKKLEVQEMRLKDLMDFLITFQSNGGFSPIGDLEKFYLKMRGWIGLESVDPFYTKPTLASASPGKGNVKGVKSAKSEGNGGIKRNPPSLKGRVFEIDMESVGSQFVALDSLVKSFSDNGIDYSVETFGNGWIHVIHKDRGILYKFFNGQLKSTHQIKIKSSEPPKAGKPRASANLLKGGSIAALVTPVSTRGGIDFDDKYLQMNMHGDGINLTIPAGFEWLLNTPIPGFTPQILDIRSGLGFQLSFFKGLLTPQQERSAKSRMMIRLASLCDHKFVIKDYIRSA